MVKNEEEWEPNSGREREGNGLTHTEIYMCIRKFTCTYRDGGREGGREEGNRSTEV